MDVDVAMRGRKTGVVERFPVAGHLGAHRPLELSYVPSVHYTGGGPQAMADGRRGSLDFRDGACKLFRARHDGDGGFGRA